MNPELRISLCSVCGKPAHASETDDLDRCEACRPTPTSLTIDETRRRIAAIHGDRCSDHCPGWYVFETNRDPVLEIERCDECFSHLPDSETVMDDDVEQLPEAIEALRCAREGL